MTVNRSDSPGFQSPKLRNIVEVDPEFLSAQKGTLGFQNFVNRTALTLLGSGAVIGTAFGLAGTTQLGAWSGLAQAALITLVSVPLLRRWVLSAITQDLEVQTNKLKATLEREKALQEALRQSEDKYRTMIEHVPAITYIAALRAEDGLLYISPQVRGLLGYSQDDFRFQPALWEDVIHPDDRERVLVQRNQTVANGDALGMEYRAIGQDGRVIWLRDEAAVVRDSSTGAAVVLQGVMLDISETKRAEEALRHREEQLRQSQKMEAVGRLAGGVAHDFNNMLAVINGYSEMLLTLSGIEDPNIRCQLEEIHRAGDRAAGLTRQLLAFSRNQVLKPQIMDVNEVVVAARKMLERLIGEDIHFETSLDPHLTPVRADAGQVEQVIMNLAVNARDAMPQGGSILLRTRNTLVSDPPEREHAGAAPGEYAEILVTDTGCGMDEETCLRIFEPFFTTKEPGKGTGLGLSTVYGIVHQSGGHMCVDSAVGVGTTFRIFLPACAHERVDEEDADETGSGSGSETVLLVEDEEMLRTLMQSLLEQKGYQVLSASGGEQALALAREHSGPLHLLLTDVVLPGVSGHDTAQYLLDQRPDLRILYMSGYTPDEVEQRGVSAEQENFIHKPFTPDVLVSRVRDTLDEALV